MNWCARRVGTIGVARAGRLRWLRRAVSVAGMSACGRAEQLRRRFTAARVSPAPGAPHTLALHGMFHR